MEHKCDACGKPTEKFDLDHYYCEECLKVAYEALADLDAILAPFVASGKAVVIHNLF